MKSLGPQERMQFWCQISDLYVNMSCLCLVKCWVQEAIKSAFDVSDRSQRVPCDAQLYEHDIRMPGALAAPRYAVLWQRPLLPRGKYMHVISRTLQIILNKRTFLERASLGLACIVGPIDKKRRTRQIHQYIVKYSTCSTIQILNYYWNTVIR